jgi:hypothetical protein
LEAPANNGGDAGTARRLAEGADASDRGRMSRSNAKLARSLAARGHAAHPNKVGRLLRELGYRLQASLRAKEGWSRGARQRQAKRTASESPASGSSHLAPAIRLIRPLERRRARSAIC